MFCYKCGMKLPDEAKFCMGCGTKLEGVAQEQPVNSAQDTKLVLAKCTNCGGQLTVDAGQKSAVCPFCNSKFLIEQAINNYNFNMHGNMNVGSATINVNGTQQLSATVSPSSSCGVIRPVLTRWCRSRCLPISLMVISVRHRLRTMC